MTPDEFAAAMLDLAALSEDDPEAAHADADGLMQIVLRQHGYDKGVVIFDSMKKWYA